MGNKIIKYDFMNIDLVGKIYTGVMSVYFMFSGLNALMDIDSKLARIGLSAVDIDGKVAFILIYCSLMTGIGIAIAVIFYLSKSWIYSTVLAIVIIASFVCFRLIGSMLLGTVTNIQLSYIIVELIEVAVGVMLLIKSKKLQRPIA